MKRKLGLSVSAYEISEEWFKKYSAAGIDVLEICPSGDGYEYKTVDYGKLLELSKKYNVELWSFHLPYGPFSEIDLSSNSAEHRANTMKVYKGIIERVSKIGIKNFIVHPSAEPIDEKDRPSRIENSKKSLVELADFAEKFGCTIAVEDVPRTCLGNCSDELLYLTEDERLKVCFDTNHLLFEDISHFVKAIGKKMLTTHVSDYDFVDEKHWMPGEGKIDWQQMIADFDEIGYDGPFLYEVGFASYTGERKDDYTPWDFKNNYDEILENRPLTKLGK